MVEVMKIMVTSFKRSKACTAILTQCSIQAAAHHCPTPPPETPGHPQASLLWGHCSFLLRPGAQGSVCALQESISQSCVSSGSSMVGFNGDLPQEDLCHMHTQSPFPCGRPLPTRTSAGDAQTQFCPSLCGPLGPGEHKVCLSPLSVSGGNGV